jgi:hypothetical protein
VTCFHVKSSISGTSSIETKFFLESEFYLQSRFFAASSTWNWNGATFEQIGNIEFPIKVHVNIEFGNFMRYIWLGILQIIQT